MLRACIVQGSQQIWVAALWYWGHQLNNSTTATPPWWTVLILWPLAAMSFLFAYLMLYGLPGELPLVYSSEDFSSDSSVFPRILPSDATQGTQLPQDLVPQEARSLVPRIRSSSGLLVVWGKHHPLRHETVQVLTSPSALRS